MGNLRTRWWLNWKWNVLGDRTRAMGPGTGGVGTPPFDNIGNPAERSPGLAVLRIQYSDGEHGILVLSCHLVGTPDSVFEGITASKGFVDYYNSQVSIPGVNANRTLFHVRQ